MTQRIPDLWIGVGVGLVAIGAMAYLGSPLYRPGNTAVDAVAPAAAPSAASAHASAAAPAAAASQAGAAPANPNDIAGDPPSSDLVASRQPVGAGSAFRPPADDAIPDGEFGDVIRAGREIFTDTGRAAAAFVGNGLRCSNCHLDAGRLADSAPLWAAFVSYPAYRSKTRSVSTFGERLQGCFEYSMNGRAPALGSKELVALETYSHWLAQGAPVDPKLPGRGYPPVEKPPQAADYARGEQVYVQNCALCHGADGAGQRAADGTPVFPALWGSGSFNWGAGMGRVSNAAAFIKANMPLGLAGTLSAQQAWDVALYMNSHERPQDPRWTGSVKSTRQAFHDTADSPYGTTVDGRLLGDSGPPKTFVPRSAARNNGAPR